MGTLIKAVIRRSDILEKELQDTGKLVEWIKYSKNQNYILTEVLAPEIQRLTQSVIRSVNERASEIVHEYFFISAVDFAQTQPKNNL